MKKKLFAIALAVLLPLGLLAGSGDVNGDGKINIADIVELVNHLRGNTSEKFIFDEADANNDGNVDENDVHAIAELIQNGAEVVAADFELVIEKTDGTSYMIPITHNCPILGLAFLYAPDYLEVNMSKGSADDDKTYVLCSEIKRIYTRDYQGKISLPPSFVQAEASTPKSYGGQHVSFKLTSGESIQYDLMYVLKFNPTTKDGKIVWNIEGSRNFTLDNVESIDFISYNYDEVEVRKALIELYNEMNGDNWPESYKENWCTDEPIWKWHGINEYDEGKPYVVTLDLHDLMFGANSISTSTFPKSIERMGPIGSLNLANTQIEGSIPSYLGNIYSLDFIDLYGNKLSGTIPESICKLPYINYFDIQNNQFEGQLPEKVIMWLMDRLPGNNVNFDNNFFTGKVPEGIRNHPKFCEYWPALLIQKGKGLDLSDLKIPAPAFTTKDMSGNTIDLAEIYKKNKYTLLYKWAFWCPFSEVYNKKVLPVYNAYKDNGFEIIGIHYDINYDDGLAEYKKDHDIPWRNIIARDWAYSDYDGAGLFQWGTTPEVYLVDQNGNIVFNSFMDEKGKLPLTYDRKEHLFPYLEKIFGPVNYDFYTSTDYSKDGEVMTLQKATQGQGIDLVFVGEGFTDKDLEDGEEYEWYMKKALNQFFLYEPYRSLQPRFNVYAVKAVSPNAEFYGNATHAIDEDVSKAFEYASKVPNLIEGRPMFVNVIYKEDTGGRSYCKMLEDDSYVAFMMDGVSNVLNHEAGGHGIGKLFDEYVEYTGLTLPEEEKTELENYWTTAGWGANVDWHSDPTEVKWSAFVSDNSYADENIGAYEGCYLYQFGAYRPTENSMMRYNDTPFNAPSREAIYKRVMKLSEGDSWTYDRDEFVTFDTSGHAQFVEAQTSASRAMARGSVNDRSNTQKRITTRPPVILKGTWRDATKCEKVEYTSKPVGSSFKR